MINRIIQIREESKLSQEKFAARLNLSRNFINQVENGKKNISERTIFDICREFNINEEWLRNGTKPMHLPASAKFSSYLGEISAGDDYLIREIIEIYMELDQQSKDALRVIADKFAKKRIRRLERE